METINSLFTGIFGDIDAGQVLLILIIGWGALNILPKILGGTIGGILKGAFNFVADTSKSAMSGAGVALGGSRWPKAGKLYSFGDMEVTNMFGSSEKVADLRIPIGRKRKHNGRLAGKDTVLWVRPDAAPDQAPGETHIAQWNHKNPTRVG